MELLILEREKFSYYRKNVALREGKVNVLLNQYGRLKEGKEGKIVLLKVLLKERVTTVVHRRHFEGLYHYSKG